MSNNVIGSKEIIGRQENENIGFLDLGGDRSAPVRARANISIIP